MLRSGATFRGNPLVFPQEPRGVYICAGLLKPEPRAGSFGDHVAIVNTAALWVFIRCLTGSLCSPWRRVGSQRARQGVCVFVRGRSFLGWMKLGWRRLVGREPAETSIVLSGSAAMCLLCNKSRICMELTSTSTSTSRTEASSPSTYHLKCQNYRWRKGQVPTWWAEVWDHQRVMCLPCLFVWFMTKSERTEWQQKMMERLCQTAALRLSFVSRM